MRQVQKNNIHLKRNKLNLFVNHIWQPALNQGKRIFKYHQNYQENLSKTFSLRQPEEDISKPSKFFKDSKKYIPLESLVQFWTMYPNGTYSEIEFKVPIEGTITYKTYKTNANKHTQKKQNPTPTEQKLKDGGHRYLIISNPPKILFW